MIKRVFLCLSVFVLSCAVQAHQAHRGVLDLRQADLTGEKVYLDGEWAFFWQELVDPGDKRLATPSDFFDFPELWNGATSRSGELLSHEGYATYKLSVLLPADAPSLALYVKHVYSAYSLYANRRLIATGGTVGKTKQVSSPLWVPRVIYLPHAEELDLVLHISNFRHAKGGARESLVLASEQTISAMFMSLLGYDLLLAGTLLMAGLFFCGLFFFGQRERAALFFSLFCLTFAYRVMGADDYSLQIVYPRMSWLLSLRLEYLALFIPPVFFALYTHTLFPLTYRINLFYVFAGISIALALATLIFPPAIFTLFVEPYLGLLLLGIVLVGFVYIRAHLRDLQGARHALLSSWVVLLVFTYKIFVYIGALHEVEVISFVGYLLFFFFQSLILFFLFTNSLKKAKEEAEHAARTKSDFLSMMSHEIRTPMNAVIGLSNYLLEDNPRKAQVDILNALKFSAKNLLVIINDILDFSKIEAEKIEFDYQSVHFRNLLNSIHMVFRPIAEEKGLRLVFSCDPRIPGYIVCDETRTSQVYNNLISNAIKFTDEGEVRIEVNLLERGVDYVRLRSSVSDTGIGIPKAMHQDIFKSFTQVRGTASSRNQGGTGLGLSITKRLLTLQGGSLMMESEEGRGSTFYFDQDFRIAEQVGQEDKDEPKRSVRASQGQWVLLVEDNEINVMVASKFLQKWGVKVSVAKNGQEALEMVDLQPYDLVLMDLQMPVMDGYEAVRRMRQKGVSIPIVALTASALIEEQRKIFEAGMDDYVTKPFDPADLWRKIQYFTH